MSEEIQEKGAEFEAIKAAFEEKGELEDEQLDVVADVAIEILRSLLAFGEITCSIDEYDGDAGELILE